MFNALMPGEHDWIGGKPMPGQVQSSPLPEMPGRMAPPVPLSRQAPAQKKRPIMNALSAYFQIETPEAYQSGVDARTNRDMRKAMAGEDYEGAARAAMAGGRYEDGFKLKQYTQDQQTAQRQQEAQGVMQLFSNMQPLQINDYALSDPAGFEQMTGMTSEEYLDTASRLQQAGMTPEQFHAYVIQKAQAELGMKGGEGYTLGPGQVRYGPDGQELARGPDKAPTLPSGMYINPETGQPEYLPGYLEGQRQIAEARGSNANNVQSTFTGEDGTQYIVRRDGSLEPLNVKARNPYQITNVGDVPYAIDRQTGQGVAVTTPETVGANKATVETITSNEKARQQAQQDLPKTIATIDRGIATLEALKASPGFSSRYGLASVIPAIPGTDMADTQALINQIGGQAFLTAFESLKGGGQITEIEGQKATQAITVLTTQGITVQMAARAIDDLIEVQQSAKARMTAQASGSYAPQGADAAPLKYNPETGEFE